MLKSSGNERAPFPRGSSPAPWFWKAAWKGVLAPGLGTHLSAASPCQQVEGSSCHHRFLILLCTSSSLWKVTSPGIINEWHPSVPWVAAFLPKLHLFLWFRGEENVWIGDGEVMTMKSQGAQQAGLQSSGPKLDREVSFHPVHYWINFGSE